MKFRKKYNTSKMVESAGLTSEKQQIRVWAGERKLMPLIEGIIHYRCVFDAGFLRVISSAGRKKLTPGDEYAIALGDIATITAEKIGW